MALGLLYRQFLVYESLDQLGWLLLSVTQGGCLEKRIGLNTVNTVGGSWLNQTGF